MKKHPFVLCVLFLFLFSSMTWAEDVVFRGGAIELAVGPDSKVTRLSYTGADGKVEDWQGKPDRLCLINQGGKWSLSTEFTKGEKDQWQVHFGKTGVSATIKITGEKEGIVFELVSLAGGEVDSICFGSVFTNVKKELGSVRAILSDEQKAIAFIGLSDSVQTSARADGFVGAYAHSDIGLEGRRAILMATTPDAVLDHIRRIEEAYDLPNPKLGGEWAKTSDDGNTGYLFTDLTEENVDETIRYAKMGGFRYILIYANTWSTSLGSYPIRTKNFPQGEASLKAVVDKCHAAGLKVGIHTLTSYVGINDPLVRPVPDPRLLKDGEAILAEDIDEKATDILARGALDAFPGSPTFTGSSRAVHEFQIDDEIIGYRFVTGEDEHSFVQCKRGHNGTKAAPHKAGAKIQHLAGRSSSYLVDLRTDLKDQVSERIAGLINRCGLDMVYFDGSEANAANGPFWYWVSQQQHDTCRRVTRPLRVQASSMNSWMWHWQVRGVCDDFAAVATEIYLDYHKIGDAWESYRKNFVPAELGWWGFLTDAPHQRATTPDEVAYYGTRMVALDSPISMETSLSKLQDNGRTEEMLRLLNEYEQIRRSGIVPKETREKLRTGEWKLLPRTTSDPIPHFVPTRYQEKRVDGAAEVRMENEFAAQPLKLRLRCLTTLAAADDEENVSLFPSGSPLELTLPEKKAPMPGALAQRIEFAKADGDQPDPLMVSANPVLGGPATGKLLDLTQHRGIAVRLIVESDDAEKSADEKPAVLNVQLETTNKMFRDYDIDLDFVGERIIVLPEATTERILPEFRPHGANYPYKLAMYGFNYGGISAVNLRWMRAPKTGLRCRVLAITAVAEHPIPLENPSITVAGEKITFPVTLQPDDYLELLSPKEAKVYDKNGVLLSELKLPEGTKIPTVPAGEIALSLGSNMGGNGSITLITEGKE